MSNAMSRSKSRWKGALLAAVATAVVSPLAANASMSVGVYLNPLDSASPKSLIYITPDQTGTAIPLYVYATVTGVNPVTSTSGTTSAPISSGDFNGLQYLYYNLQATGGSVSGLTGGITSTTLNSTLGFDSTENTDPGGNTSGGTAAQAGLIDLAPGSTLAAGTTMVAVGAPTAFNASGAVSSSAMTQFAKPRAGGPVWSNYSTFNASNSPPYTYANDGTNIIIGTGSNGLATNQVAFLVETIKFTPSAFNPSSPSNLVSTSFSIGTPFNSGGGSILNSTSYAASNSFADSPVSASTYSSTSGSSLATLTSSNYSAGHSVTITDTMNGDAQALGNVGPGDLGLVLGHFGLVDTKWADGNFLYYSNGNSTIGPGDLGLVLGSFGLNIGALPSEMPADPELLADPSAVALLESYGVTPVSAVPEPASFGVIGLLAAAGLGRRRRR
jgi:hypothetical protein